jgi:leader peptidase (prepilin peptidase)/N-methyltransferase
VTLEPLPLGASLVLAGLLGLVIGSFAATLVLRWGAGRSIFGRSQCDGCGRTLGAVDLVPLFGWMIRRGRCGDCGSAIDPLHLRVELACLAIGMVSVAAFPGAAGWCLALFGWMLLPLALLDARHYWLPDALVAALALAGLLLAAPMLDTTMAARLIGAMAGGLTLALLARFFFQVRGREGMGGGDPKLAAAIGCWLGWMPLPLMFLLASASGIIWGLLTQKKDVPITEQHIPFGAFMAAAAWLAVPLWPYLNAG